MEPPRAGGGARAEAATRGAGGTAPADPASASRPAIEPSLGICPYLVSRDGSWRASRPDRDHRCTAVRPPAPIPGRTQRRFCLTHDHPDCPAFISARTLRETELARDHIPPDAVIPRPGRPLVRTVPVVVRRTRLRGPSLRAVDSPVVLAVGAVVLIALAAYLLLALPGGRAPAALPSPPASQLAVATATPSPTGTPRPSPPTTGGRTATASPSPSGRTYVVRPGDTLIVIAARFGTTPRELRRLNRLRNPNVLEVGQVIRVP